MQADGHVLAPLHTAHTKAIKSSTVNWSKLLTFSPQFNNSWSNIAGTTKTVGFRDFSTCWVRPEPTIKTLFWNLGKWKRNATVALWNLSWCQGWSFPKSKFMYFTTVRSFKHCPCFRWKWRRRKTGKWHMVPPSEGTAFYVSTEPH